jgi:hypothetical protein
MNQRWAASLQLDKYQITNVEVSLWPPLISRMMSAWDLHKALPEAEFKVKITPFSEIQNLHFVLGTEL